MLIQTIGVQVERERESAKHNHMPYMNDGHANSFCFNKSNSVGNGLQMDHIRTFGVVTYTSIFDLIFGYSPVWHSRTLKELRPNIKVFPS